jgi:two-component system, sensor histidine kinase and response regulator
MKSNIQNEHSEHSSATFLGHINAAHRHRRLRVLWTLILAWTLVAAASASWWLQDRLSEYHAQTQESTELRMTGVKDLLTLSLRHLAALPLELSHRPSVQAFLASPEVQTATPEVAAQTLDMQQTLNRLSHDLGTSVAALLNASGTVVASSASTNQLGPTVNTNLSEQPYFKEALKSGASTQFLHEQVQQKPGIYFSTHVMRNDQSLGVAIVKQDTDALNRLITAATHSSTDGTRIFVTDRNGVVLLASHADMLLKRIPNVYFENEVPWLALYQKVPAMLAWHTSNFTHSTKSELLVTFGNQSITGLKYTAASQPLNEQPFDVWVLTPLSGDSLIIKNIWSIAALLWTIGCLLIWLSWRRLQWLDDALQARRDTFELTQALPLTVFRYVRPAKGAARFSFIGRDVEKLLGLDAAAIDRDPELVWQLTGTVDRPPTVPQEFKVESGGNTSWVLADSRPKLETDGSITYNGYWLDVTMRRETQVRFAAVFEHASTSYLFFDTERGITHCNPATLRMFGTSDPSMVLGRMLWFEGLSPATQADGRPSRERALEALSDHLATQQRVYSFEWRFMRIDGMVFDAEVNVIALEWGRRPEFCAVIQDITVRKQMQATMQRAREAAEAASQTKSNFLANMSHELRTPMNAIIGMTDLALEDELSDKQHDYIEKANKSACNLLQILNDILDVSKIEAGKMGLERIDFELESVVSEMVDMLILKADEKNLELLFSAQADLPQRLIGDPTRLRQVLVNLGSNAIKFTESGEVTLGMSIHSENAKIVELHCWISDTGVGLNAEEISRLFQPFVQADSSTTRRYGGTGLGLVISRQIVERMGGRLWVESTPGQGSTFHFTAQFGRSLVHADASAVAAATDLVQTFKDENVLLVDDNPVALGVMIRIMTSMGMKVQHAQSAQEALTLLDAQPNAYQWVLIDWKMPGLSGLECARRMAETHPHMAARAVLLTGFYRDASWRTGPGQPLAGVLRKPVTPASLHAHMLKIRQQTQSKPNRLRRTGDRRQASPHRDQLAGKRALLVEDHPLNQELACEILRRVGVHVTTAQNGQDALDKLASNEAFDVVLMDCQMPGMDGYTATRKLRENPDWRTLPVIAMTASALVEDRERALACGMNAHITKPIHVDTMLRTMAEWMTGQHTQPVQIQPVAQVNPTKIIGTDAIQTTDGLSYCMGNEVLYRRVLEGFRNTEAHFVAETQLALEQNRWDDALRSSHDMKGLAGTLGARRLHAASLLLHSAVEAQNSEASQTQLERVHIELEFVMEEINTLLMQSPESQTAPDTPAAPPVH